MFGLVEAHVFNPGTDMSQALAQTVGYVDRARAFHAARETVAPLHHAISTQGSVPVGYLVFFECNGGVSRRFQDLALNRVRPAVCDSARSIRSASVWVVLHERSSSVLTRTVCVPTAWHRDEVIQALEYGKTRSCRAGNVRTGDLLRLAPDQ